MQGDYRPFERQASRSGLEWQIAFGVFVGVLGAAAVMWGVFEARVRWELYQAQSALQRQAEATVRQMEQARALEQARAEFSARQAAAAQLSANDARRAQLAESERRDAAWGRFYRPSPGCGLAGQSVECSNEYIRARRAFDAQYRPGGGT